MLGPILALPSWLQPLLSPAHDLAKRGSICCNSLDVGPPLKRIRKLQWLQNAAARVVLCRPRGACVLPLLQELRWLPVCLQVQFKVLVVTFKALHGLGPGYLKDPLSQGHPPDPPERGGRERYGSCLLRAQKVALLSGGSLPVEHPPPRD